MKTLKSENFKSEKTWKSEDFKKFSGQHIGQVKTAHRASENLKKGATLWF